MWGALDGSPRLAEPRVRMASVLPAAYAHTPARMSVRIRTRLYAALVKVKIQPTRSRPR